MKNCPIKSYIFVHLVSWTYIFCRKKTLYTRARRLRAALFVWGARLINFPRTWGEQRTHGAWKGRASSSFCVRAKKPTNFDSWWMVCEPFTDGAVQVRSPVYTYMHLVCEPFGALVYTRLYAENSYKHALSVISRKAINEDLLIFLTF